MLFSEQVVKFTHLFSIFWQLIFTTSDCSETYCYTNDSHPYQGFGAKTPYLFKEPTPIDNVSAECKPIQFWKIQRHGARLPMPSEVPIFETNITEIQKQIISNYEISHSYPENGGLCKEDYENIKKWKLDKMINSESSNDIAPIGKVDIKRLAKIYKQRFPTLFSSSYNSKDYMFHYIPTKCVLKSYKAYFEGLFGYPPSDKSLIRRLKESIRTEMDIKKVRNFSILKTLLDENQLTEEPEDEKFTKSEIVTKLLSDVSIKLGFDQTLNWTIVQSLYDLCRYEHSWYLNQTASPWCALFDKDQLQVLEYHEELNYYYECGYGCPYANDIGCASMKSLIYYLNKTVNGEENQPKVIINFPHRCMIQSLTVVLNLNKDEYLLRADNYEQAKERKWRATFDSSYGSHLAFVLYSCHGNEKYISMLFNEKPVNFSLSDCNSSICPWSSFYNQYLPLVENGCNADTK